MATKRGDKASTLIPKVANTIRGSLMTPNTNNPPNTTVATAAIITGLYDFASSL